MSDGKQCVHSGSKMALSTSYQPVKPGYVIIEIVLKQLHWLSGGRAYLRHA